MVTLVYHEYLTSWGGGLFTSSHLYNFTNFLLICLVSKAIFKHIAKSWLVHIQAQHFKIFSNEWKLRSDALCAPVKGNYSFSDRENLTAVFLQMFAVIWIFIQNSSHAFWWIIFSILSNLSVVGILLCLWKTLHAICTPGFTIYNSAEWRATSIHTVYMTNTIVNNVLTFSHVIVTVNIPRLFFTPSSTSLLQNVNLYLQGGG